PGAIAMSATAGKVALVTNGPALTCSTGCATQPGVHDFVGYGTTASSAEGSPTPNLSNTTAAVRAGGGTVDTDNNAADFTVTAPNPRNSAGGGGATRIRDIQGAAHMSPVNGRTVTGDADVTTAKRGKGFLMQDPQPDANPATDEGVFVYVGSAPAQAVGDSVTVGGTVSEFRPGNVSTNLTITEITVPAVTVVSHGNPLPAPTLVGPGGRVPPATVIEDDATGDVQASRVRDTAT